LEKYVAKLSDKDDFFNYYLVKNDATHIKYKKGDFFKPHEDYLSLKTNMVEEYTLLLCLQGDCKGGETVFHVNKYFTHASKSSITPKNCLIFRKDLTHEGAILKSGTKEILTLNLLAIPKNNDKTVVITFENDNRFYSIPMANILQYPKSLIALYLKSNKLMDTQLVMFSSTHNITFEGFDVIYKFYQRSYLTSEECKKYKPFMKLYRVQLVDCLLTVPDSSLDSTGKKTKGSKKKQEYVFDEDIVLVSTEADVKYLTQHVKDNLLSYVPFKVVFAEGTYCYGGEMTGEPPASFKMLPVWSSFGENNNLYHFISLITTGMPSIDDISDFKICFNNKEFKTLFKQVKDKSRNVEAFTEKREEDDAYCEFNYETCKGFGLTFETNADTKSIVSNVMSRFVTFSDIKTVVPGLFKTIKDVPYELDNKGVMVINTRNAKKVIKVIEGTNDNGFTFWQALIAKINSVDFVMPQQKEHFEEDFCNENVYGNLTLITVNGFIKA